MTDYSIDEVSKLSGITTRSVRNYLRKYGDLFDLQRGHYNALRFRERDVETLIKIRTLLREGKKREEIVAFLAKDSSQPSLQVTRTQPQLDMTTLTRFLGRTETLLLQLVDENRHLRDRLEKLEGTLERGLVPSRSRLALPASSPSRYRRTELRLPLPNFLLVARDGALALGKAFYTVLFKRPSSRRMARSPGAGRASAPRETAAEPRPAKRPRRGTDPALN